MRRVLGVICLCLICIYLGARAESFRSEGVSLAVESNFPKLGGELLGE